MSGGVDSSVAAALLLREGYDVIGCFMRLGSPKGVELTETCDIDTGKSRKQGCCSVNDAADARRVANQLGVPFYVLNFQDDFGRVIDYFTNEYNAGRTPNPCVRCNDWLKFGKLEEYATAIGADFVASGHYARVQNNADTGERELLRGVDTSKDQSYVLFGVTDEALARMLLPVGGFTKTRIRELAEELDLPVFDKPDSQEICFVPDQDYAGLVERRTGTFAAGDIVDTGGRRLGEHGGFQRFTVGQRRGLGISAKVPLYVIQTEPSSNIVVVGTKQDLLSTGLVATQINLVHSSLRNANGPINCTAKIRYNAQPIAATCEQTGVDQLSVTFDEPQSAVAPGQAVVLYDGDLVLGGGWIKSAIARE
ncbi:MAG: tRNA 2-thiouridine(34) synthase MnmA [Planctomycetota bacterium]